MVRAPGQFATAHPEFRRGAIVLLTLSNPREKFWGALLDLAPAGITARGIELNSFQDFITLLKSGERVSAAVVFFPMHRVERVELDAGNGALPSLAEQFQSKSGHSAAEVLLHGASPGGAA